MSNLTTNDRARAARAEAQSVLASSRSFAAMAPHEQLALYRSLVTAALSRPEARSRGMEDAKPVNQLPDAPTMGGLTDANVKNSRLDTLADQGTQFIQDVNFPQFVKDLLKGVFDANLQVTIQQMETYQKLLKTATDSLAKFVQKVDDAAAFAYLVDQKPDEFSMVFDDGMGESDGEGGQASSKPVLADKQGNVLDLSDNVLKARIMDAKIAMAKEHRAMLRETILMGISRLVVEKGVVEASVLFDVKAEENIKRQGKSGSEFQGTKATESGGGFFSGLFGGGDETTTQERRTQISVSSVKAIADSKLAAQIKGNVKIQFKSDYFKLDNFAKLLEGGDGGASLGQIPGSSAAVVAAPGTAPR